MGRQYSVQKLTITHGNKVLDGPPFNIDAFLLEDSCVYSIQLNRLIWKKLVFVTFGIPD
jgi:hypothetical protein